jgi:hypothetical protein
MDISKYVTRETLRQRILKKMADDGELSANLDSTEAIADYCLDAIWDDIKRYLPREHYHRWVYNEFANMKYCDVPLCQAWQDVG